MKLLVFSDSHGRFSAMQEALRRQGAQAPDATLFLGDGFAEADQLTATGDPPAGTVYTVAGNCDWFFGGRHVPTSLELTLEGIHIWMLHGHTHGVKGGLGNLIAAAAARGADIVCFGHTHQPHDEYLPAGTSYASGVLEKPLRLFNPGSISVGSFGVLTLQNGTLLSSHGTL